MSKEEVTYRGTLRDYTNIKALIEAQSKIPAFKDGPKRRKEKIT